MQLILYVLAAVLLLLLCFYKPQASSQQPVGCVRQSLLLPELPAEHSLPISVTN